MLYKGVKVEQINLVIYLKEKKREHWKDNERLVLNWLRENKISAGVENPIDDLVYIYLFEDDEVKDNMKLLSDVYTKIKKEYNEVKINLHLDGFIEEEGNSIDLSLEDFKQLLIK
jgi:hypothetical protein